jgi:hypothetical protein
VQSLNDFLVFGTMAVGSFSSGGLLSGYGWDTVLWVSFAPVGVGSPRSPSRRHCASPQRSDEACKRGLGLLLEAEHRVACRSGAEKHALGDDLTVAGHLQRLKRSAAVA